MRKWLSLWWLLKSGAGVLWYQRKCAGLSLAQAADAVGIEKAVLRNIELGRMAPPCQLIFRLLHLYRADYRVQLVFCAAPCGPWDSLKLITDYFLSKLSEGQTNFYSCTERVERRIPNTSFSAYPRKLIRNFWVQK